MFQNHTEFATLLKINLNFVRDYPFNYAHAQNGASARHVNSVLGTTPLHAAVEEGRLPVIHLLFKYPNNKVTSSTQDLLSSTVLLTFCSLSSFRCSLTFRLFPLLSRCSVSFLAIFSFLSAVLSTLLRFSLVSAVLFSLPRLSLLTCCSLSSLPAVLFTHPRFTLLTCCSLSFYSCYLYSSRVLSPYLLSSFLSRCLLPFHCSLSPSILFTCCSLYYSRFFLYFLSSFPLLYLFPLFFLLLC